MSASVGLIFPAHRAVLLKVPGAMAAFAIRTDAVTTCGKMARAGS